MRKSRDDEAYIQNGVGAMETAVHKLVAVSVERLRIFYVV